MAHLSAWREDPTEEDPTVPPAWEELKTKTQGMKSSLTWMVDTFRGFFEGAGSLAISGIIKLPILGGVKQCKYMGMLWDFLTIVHCLGWQYHDPCIWKHTHQNSLIDIDLIGFRKPSILGT